MALGWWKSSLWDKPPNDSDKLTERVKSSFPEIFAVPEVRTSDLGQLDRQNPKRPRTSPDWVSPPDPICLPTDLQDMEDCMDEEQGLDLDFMQFEDLLQDLQQDVMEDLLIPTARETHIKQIMKTEELMDHIFHERIPYANIDRCMPKTDEEPFEKYVIAVKAILRQYHHYWKSDQVLAGRFHKHVEDLCNLCVCE